MIVYADILFLVNFFMNYLIVSICSAIVPEPTRNKRKLLAALLGGIYGVCMFIPNLTFMYSGFSAFLFSAAMVAILFCPCKVSDYIRSLSVFYFCSFLLSGGIFMLLPFFGGGAMRNNIIYFDTVKMLITAAVICLTVLWLLKYIKRRFNSGGFYVSVRYRGKSTSARAMTDTGNMLCDAKCGNPVIVADEELLKRLFDKDCSVFNMSEWIDSRDLRLIPYKTLDKAGVMNGFLADEVVYGRKYIKNVTIAISPQRLEHGLLINSEILRKE